MTAIVKAALLLAALIIGGGGLGAQDAVAPDYSYDYDTPATGTTEPSAPTTGNSEPNTPAEPDAPRDDAAAEAMSFPTLCYSYEYTHIDLDGDGYEEEIWYAPDYDPDYSYLEINGINYFEDMMDQGMYYDNPELDCFVICDLDEYDDSLELAFMDYGPSDDYVTTFFRYEDGELIMIGEIPDLIYSYWTDEFNFYFDGAGSVEATFRLGVLQTWFAYGLWYYNGYDLEFCDYDTYYSTYDIEVNATGEVALYYEPYEGSFDRYTYTGETLYLYGTDNDEWVVAYDESGYEYWLHLDDDGWQVETADGYQYATFVLEGLWMAD